MTSTLIEQSPALVRAIHQVFHDSDPCFCHNVGKLSEQEVVEALVRHHHVAVADARQENILPVRRLFDKLRQSPWLKLERAGAKFLPDLQSWAYADLLRLDGVGCITATEIEAEMARHGLVLKDGDPRRFQHLLEDEPEPDRATVALPPDEIRGHCAKELIDSGQRLIQTGATLINFAVRANKRVRVGGALKNSLKVGVRIVREVESVVNLLHSFEQREAASRPLPKPSPRVPAEARQQGNVITGAFVPPVDPNDAWAHGLAM